MTLLCMLTGDPQMVLLQVHDQGTMTILCSAGNCCSRCSDRWEVLRDKGKGSKQQPTQQGDSELGVSPWG